MPAGVGPTRAERQRAQTVVEFSLVAPVLILMLFLLIDFGRLVYTYGAISWAAREGARLATLDISQTSDCAILQRVEQVGRGFPITPDPHSIAPNSDPNNPSGTNQPSQPPAGQGFVYIWPAVATANPPDSNCNGLVRNVTASAQMVAVEIQYTYQPLLPLFNSFVPNMTIKTVSVVRTEY